MEPAKQIEVFKEFFDAAIKPQVLEAINSDAGFFVVDFQQLAGWDPELANDLLEDPENVLKAASIAVSQIEPRANDVEVRMKNLSASSRISVSNIRSKDLRKLIQVRGIVRQKSDVRPQVVSSKFECPSCGAIIPVLQLDSKFKEPTRCQCGRKGFFREVSKQLVDAQKIVLEEASDELEGGDQPKRLNILLKKDLVSPMSDRRTNPGSKLEVVGYLNEVPIQLPSGGKSTRFDIMLETNYVDPVQEDFSQLTITEEERAQIEELAKDPEVFDKLVSSVAPSIYGHERVKEALILQMLGGVQKTRPDGVVTRGDMHILLIGDPGSGKCVTGDTLVQLADGSIKPIATVFEEQQGEAKGENAFTPKEPFSVVSVEGHGFETKQEVTTVWQRTEEKPLLQITLRSGDVLTLTQDHPLFTTIDGYAEPLEAKEFKAGMPVMASRIIRPKTRTQLVPQVQQSAAHNGKAITIPVIVEQQFARLLGYIAGDGWVQKRATNQPPSIISFTNNDEETLYDYRRIIESLFGISVTERQSHKGKTAREIYTANSTLHSLIRAIAPEIAQNAGEKHVPQVIMRSPLSVSAAFLQALFECDAHTSPKARSIQFCTKSHRMAREVRMLLLRFGIRSQLLTKEKYATNTIAKTRRTYYEVHISGAAVDTYCEFIGFVSQRKRAICHGTQTNTNRDILPGVAAALRELRKAHKRNADECGVPASSYKHYEKGERMPSREQLQKIIASFPAEDDLAHKLDVFSRAEVFWDFVESIVKLPAQPTLVYDFEVAQTHNFVAECTIIHNSQMLKRVTKVAPKARFVSGKGSSAAGLTASVVKDEFLRGYALEAGALVLANKGFCCIDELDKMSPEDRSAFHEALEQQTVTISKANVQATLRCETVVLAAANPKYGRFDPYELLAKQIDLPSTLINRFDLIFPIKDMPNKGRDEQMAHFILSMHQKQDVQPGAMDTDLLKKYISFARQTCKPVLSNDALIEIKQFYVDLRSSGKEAEMQSIPISARQLEGLVRIAEASAKSRLSKIITREDARKAIDLVYYCLSQIGIDPQTGKLDIDRASGNIPASERNIIHQIKDIIKQLADMTGNSLVPEEDILTEAKSRGLNDQKVEEALEKLNQKGDIFRPRHGFYSMMK
jgi:replicative DNA helicase Mcm